MPSFRTSSRKPKTQGNDKAQINKTKGKRQATKVNHKNEIKTDNRAENLEWCTNKFNVNYSLKKKYKEESVPIPIKALKDDAEYYFESLNEAARFTEADTKSIRDCLKNKRKTAKGFSFFSFGIKKIFFFVIV